MAQLDQILWQEWGEEAFNKAKAEDKPILLAIGAVWCHWCHVMDQTSYSDPAVIELINNEFVPIRVDNDRRPDINERYNLGGWPTTAILTPEGHLLSGGTYIPPAQLQQLLLQVVQVYHQRRVDLYAQILQQTQLEDIVPRYHPGQDGIIDTSFLKAGLRKLEEAFDPFHGGFGREPKFPNLDALTLALYHYFLTGDDVFGQIVFTSLDKMGWSGMYDQEEGGFFRYSTSRNWGIPHFEKMLEDNAGFIKLYLEAYMVSGDNKYRDKAQQIINYLKNTLSNPEAGGFYGSQDADEEYYKLNQVDRQRVSAPTIDRTIYTNWNAKTISSYLYAYSILGDPYLRDFALTTLTFILTHCYTERGVLCHYFKESPQVPGLLTDAVYLGQALLDSFQLTQDSAYLTRAINLAQTIKTSYADLEGGGFFDTIKDVARLGYLARPIKPLELNATAVLFFLNLYSLTDEEEYHQLAEKTLLSFKLSIHQHGFLAVRYFLAVQRYLTPLMSITVEGGDSRLWEEGLRVFYPWKDIRHADRDKDKAVPALLVCLGNSCWEPITDPHTLARLIRERVRNEHST